jgi:hypothetical protein
MAPDSFNRKFDTIKNVVTKAQMDAIQIDRIAEVKKQAKKD